MDKKVRISLRFICLLTAFLPSCKKALKKPEDYYPKVETISAEVTPEAYALIKGKLVSKGGAPIDYIGFCASTSPNPTITDHQKLVQLVGNNFQVVYNDLSEDSTYYFRAWASNKYGYSYGKQVYLDSITSPITPPCNLPVNQIALESYAFPIYLSSVFYDEPTSQEGHEVFRIDCNYGYVKVVLPYLPHSGTYTTTTDEYFTGRKIKVVLFFVNSTFPVDSGATAYIVKKPGLHDYTLTICEATTTSFGETNTFNMRSDLYY